MGLRRYDLSKKCEGKYKDCVDCVLDKIRAEIKQLPTTKCTETHRTYIDADDFKETVLVIIDKHKTESEAHQ